MPEDRPRWRLEWEKFLAAETKRYADVGVTYPLTPDQPVSEIVACAFMSTATGKAPKSRG